MFSIFKASTAMHSYHKTALVSRLSSSPFHHIPCTAFAAASASYLSVSSSSTRCSLLKRSIAHRISDSPLPSESEFMPLYCALNLFLWSLCFFYTNEREPLSASVSYDYLLYLQRSDELLWEHLLPLRCIIYNLSDLFPVSILKPDWFIKLLNFAYLYRSFPTFFPFFFSSDKV